jgi:hypothetical protein
MGGATLSDGGTARTQRVALPAGGLELPSAAASQPDCAAVCGTQGLE